ncbi:MAG: response regulator [Anaerolineae bacterium]|nr:response regulator [Anaerolineae bacterium]
MMISYDDFSEFVSSAYQHLYDFVYLRTHPLVKHMAAEAQASGKERGWRLHHLLLEAIRELDPGPKVPPYSREWRRHRLMSLRYIDGLEPQQVADQLSISRRQYYREHAAAMEAITQVFWGRFAASSTAPLPNSLLQQEIARVAQREHQADLQDVIGGVLSLLGTTLEERQIEVRLSCEDALPPVMIGHNLLRQVLLGILGYMIENAARTTLRLTVNTVNGGICLRIQSRSPGRLSLAQAQERIAPLQEMLSPPDALLTVMEPESHGFGLQLMLRTDRRATILIVDDNADMLALYEHYLTANHFQVIRTDHAEAAIDLATRMQPAAVILDLMMPDQDGWEVLRALSTEPATAHIPIVICSVLKQKELALTLGADIFLEKPINEADLMAALHALD